MGASGHGSQRLDRDLNALASYGGYLAFGDAPLIHIQSEGYASARLRNAFIPETHDPRNHKPAGGMQQDMDFPTGRRPTTARRRARWRPRRRGFRESRSTIALIPGEVFDLVVRDPARAQREAQSSEVHGASAKLLRTHAIRGQRDRGIGRSPETDEQRKRRNDVRVRHAVKESPRHR